MKRTVLYPVHRDLEARLVEFGGFEMPVQYRSIVEEHIVELESTRIKCCTTVISRYIYVLNFSS